MAAGYRFGGSGKRSRSAGMTADFSHNGEHCAGRIDDARCGVGNRSLYFFEGLA